METPQPTTLKQDFDRYFAACYPADACPQQKVEVHQAFMVGALVAMDKPGKMVKGGITDMDELEKHVMAFRREAIQALETRSQQMGQRN